MKYFKLVDSDIANRKPGFPQWKKLLERKHNIMPLLSIIQLCKLLKHQKTCEHIKDFQKESTASVHNLLPRSKSIWDIQETVTFLDPGFHETTQEEFDGDIKDRPTSLKDIKKMGGSIIVGR